MLPALLIVLSAALMVRADEKVSKEEALKFNEELAGANKKLFAAGQAFGAQLGFLQDKPTDLDALKSEQEKLLKVVKDVTAQMKSVKVPKAKTAEELYKLHQKFIEGQNRMMDEAIKPVVELAGDKNVADADKKTKALEIFQKAFASEGAMVQELQKVQKAFADEFGIPLMGGAP